MLGEQVRNIRKKRGITLKELAEKTGLSLSLIHISLAFRSPHYSPIYPKIKSRRESHSFTAFGNMKS